MSAVPDATHDPHLKSWVDSANADDTDFPIQNLPFGRFRFDGEARWHIGVAIGDQVLDLRQAGLIDHGDMNRLMRSTLSQRSALRQALSAGLRYGSEQSKRLETALVAQSAVELGLPCEIGDYTDFYVGIHHATEVGRQFRPDTPLLPNYKWVPIGYHGRASTLQASGGSFHRPMGQIKAADAAVPVLAPTARLDIELELGIFVGQPNVQGVPVRMQDAEQHVFGITLFNDWSARDIQSWEYQPLGPFLSKNFASTVSPWMVTMEALQPFRQPFARPAGDPEPLPYLDSPDNRSRGAIDIQMEVVLQTARMAQARYVGDVISRSNFAEAAYWTVAQLVAHHTVNGCALRAGDLFGSGTLSGADKGQCGSLLELTTGGKHPITLSNGERRTFLEDGDTIVLRAYCERDGARRIGFGECRGTVLPMFVQT
ncbi:fumarylacetoacetase [Ralstonia syzygii]|uniref:fumarylacetoacetase n=1 Tax=Ralstonia syzygii R24 TaxID=907261 RepID=G3A5N2_9RALS|nr:fumarylacetoacetase [Ralstonia syzygii]CCA88763.1 Fumarylacetoacetase (Fumarylacetoacetate hydrolase) [Ralstonia syzygii R24]